MGFSEVGVRGVWGKAVACRAVHASPHGVREVTLSKADLLLCLLTAAPC